MKSRIIPACAALALLFSTVLIAGCDDHTDKISSIVNNPRAYAGRDVRVAGEVTKVYELPLGITNLAAYRVSDGTSQIWVLSHAGAPREGDKVGIKGSVDQEGKIGTMALGSVIEEKERKVQ